MVKVHVAKDGWTLTVRALMCVYATLISGRALHSDKDSIKLSLPFLRLNITLFNLTK